jgi:hypothetical protein
MSTQQWLWNDVFWKIMPGNIVKVNRRFRRCIASKKPTRRRQQAGKTMCGKPGTYVGQESTCKPTSLLWSPTSSQRTLGRRSLIKQSTSSSAGSIMWMTLFSPGPRLHKLKYFLDHLNCVHQNIHFTLETERDGHLSCPDTDIYRRPHGSLGL